MSDEASMRDAPPGAALPDITLTARPRTRLQRIRQACRQMFGIPDYERYAAHMQARHPDKPLLSEREFHAMAIDIRYGGSRPRCC
jgi:uncharacterized short protein YbdD (DUF466 family)